MSRGDVVVRWAVAVDGSDTTRPLAHRLLVDAVAELAGADRGAVALRRRCPTCGSEEHGRPSVTVAGRPGPPVSIAHAGALAVVAISGDQRPVGVDVEPIDAVVPPELGLDVRGWVRLEAALKATGHGLAVDPALVGLSPSGRFARWEGPGRRPSARVVDVSIGPGHLVAVARLGRTRPRVQAPVRWRAWGGAGGGARG